MDCQTILQNEFHEKYLSEQLSEEERSEYVRHLNQCKSCQKQLEDQRLFIAGIRAMGREQMKAEIRMQVKEQRVGKTESFDWTRLAKIAAVLFMFVMIPGVFYYYQKTDSASLRLLAPEVEDTRTATEDEAATSAEADQTEQVDKLTQEPTKPQTTESTVSGAVPSSEKSETPKRQQKMQESEEAVTVSAESQKTANEMGKSEPPKASAAAGSELSEPASTPSSEKKDYTIKQYRPSQSSLYEMAVTPEDQGQMDSRPLNKAVSDEQKHLQLKKAPLDHSGKAGTTDAKNSGEREQEGFDAFVSMFAQRLHFTSDGRAIIVYIIEPAEKQAKRDGREFPQSFPVRITRRDSSSLEMVWQLDLPLVKMDTDEVGVEMLPDQIMRVVFEDAQVSYRVDLKADSTSAISEK